MSAADANPDGTVVVTQEGDHNISVWNDPGAPEPSSWRLPPTAVAISMMNLSHNGDRLAVVTEDGAVDVWNLRDRSGPINVRAPESSPLPPMAVVTHFDENGKWLAIRLDRTHVDYLHAPGNTDRVELYDMSRTAPTRVALLPGQQHVTQYPRYIDPAGAVIVFEEVGADSSRNVLRDARTGRLIRKLPMGEITSTGAIAGCVDGSLVIWDAVTGVERFRPGPSRETTTGTCAWDADERTGRYVLWTAAGDHDNVKTAEFVDVETGRRYTQPWAHSEVGTAHAPLIVPTDRGPQLLSITPTGLTRFAPAVRTEGRHGFPALSQVEWGPQGRFVVRFELGENSAQPTARLYELVPRHRLVAQTSVETIGFPPARITDDGEHLILATRTGGVTIYSLPDLTVERRLTLPFPALLGERRPSATSIVQLGDDELVFYFAGLLTRWRISDGEQIGEQVATWRDEHELRWMVAVGSAANSVPMHQDRIMVSGTDADLVLGVHDGRVLQTIPVDRSADAEAFTRPDEPIMYVRYGDSGASRMHNLDTGEVSESPQPIPAGTPIGGTADGLLVVNNGQRFEVWDFDRGTKLFDITVPGFAVSGGATVIDRTVRILSEEGDVYTVNLDRTDMMRRLCAINDRDYTDSERAALPVAADTTPPCAGI